MISQGDLEQINHWNLRSLFIYPVDLYPGEKC